MPEIINDNLNLGKRFFFVKVKLLAVRTNSLLKKTALSAVGTTVSQRSQAGQPVLQLTHNF